MEQYIIVTPPPPPHLRPHSSPLSSIFSLPSIPLTFGASSSTFPQTTLTVVYLTSFLCPLPPHIHTSQISLRVLLYPGDVNYAEFKEHGRKAITHWLNRADQTIENPAYETQATPSEATLSEATLSEATTSEATPSPDSDSSDTPSSHSLDDPPSSPPSSPFPHFPPHTLPPSPTLVLFLTPPAAKLNNKMRSFVPCHAEFMQQTYSLPPPSVQFNNAFSAATISPLPPNTLPSTTLPTPTLPIATLLQLTIEHHLTRRAYLVDLDTHHRTLPLPLPEESASSTVTPCFPSPPFYTFTYPIYVLLQLGLHTSSLQLGQISAALHYLEEIKPDAVNPLPPTPLPSSFAPQTLENNAFDLPTLLAALITTSSLHPLTLSQAVLHLSAPLLLQLHQHVDYVIRTSHQTILVYKFLSTHDRTLAETSAISSVLTVLDVVNSQGELEGDEKERVGRAMKELLEFGKARIEDLAKSIPKLRHIFEDGTVAKHDHTDLPDAASSAASCAASSPPSLPCPRVSALFTPAIFPTFYPTYLHTLASYLSAAHYPRTAAYLMYHLSCIYIRLEQPANAITILRKLLRGYMEQSGKDASARPRTEEWPVLYATVLLSLLHCYAATNDDVMYFRSALHVFNPVLSIPHPISWLSKITACKIRLQNRGESCTIPPSPAIIVTVTTLAPSITVGHPVPTIRATLHSNLPSPVVVTAVKLTLLKSQDHELAIRAVGGSGTAATPATYRTLVYGSGGEDGGEDVTLNPGANHLDFSIEMLTDVSVIVGNLSFVWVTPGSAESAGTEGAVTPVTVTSPAPPPSVLLSVHLTPLNVLIKVNPPTPTTTITVIRHGPVTNHGVLVATNSDILVETQLSIKYTKKVVTMTSSDGGDVECNGDTSSANGSGKMTFIVPPLPPHTTHLIPVAMTAYKSSVVVCNLSGTYKPSSGSDAFAVSRVTTREMLPAKKGDVCVVGKPVVRVICTEQGGRRVAGMVRVICRGRLLRWSYGGKSTRVDDPRVDNDDELAEAANGNDVRMLGFSSELTDDGREELEEIVLEGEEGGREWLETIYVDVGGVLGEGGEGEASAVLSVECTDVVVNEPVGATFVLRNCGTMAEEEEGEGEKRFWEIKYDESKWRVAGKVRGRVGVALSSSAPEVVRVTLVPIMVMRGRHAAMPRIEIEGVKVVNKWQEREFTCRHGEEVLVEILS